MHGSDDDNGAGADSQGYEIVTSKNCASEIESIEECSRAAAAVGVADTTAEDDNQSGAPLDPAGCYFEGGKLKMNVKGGNRGRCSSRDQCLCREPIQVPTGQPYAASPTVLPTGVAKQSSNTLTVNPTTGYPTPSRYQLLTSG